MNAHCVFCVHVFMNNFIYVKDAQKMLMRNILILALIAFLMAGCSEPSENGAAAQDASEFAGSWRVYSERLFYDIGGAGPLGYPVSRNLEIRPDGTWSFGPSNVKWSVSEITEDDWKGWGIEAYGPTRKITFDGWNKGTSIGPVEESDGRVDFVWVIYNVEPTLVENAGTVWIKFGR